MTDSMHLFSDVWMHGPQFSYLSPKSIPRSSPTHDMMGAQNPPPILGIDLARFAVVVMGGAAAEWLREGGYPRGANGEI